MLRVYEFLQSVGLLQERQQRKPVLVPFRIFFYEFFVLRHSVLDIFPSVFFPRFPEFRFQVFGFPYRQPVSRVPVRYDFFQSRVRFFEIFFRRFFVFGFGQKSFFSHTLFFKKRKRSGGSIIIINIIIYIIYIITREENSRFAYFVAFVKF